MIIGFISMIELALHSAIVYYALAVALAIGLGAIILAVLLRIAFMFLDV